MTTLSILGAGNMARGIATRALAGGHGVQILSRDPKNAEALAKDLEHAAPGAVTVGRGSVGDALVGEIVVLAVPYDSALALVEQYGRAPAGTPVRYQPISDAEAVAGLVAAGLPEAVAGSVSTFGRATREGWFDVVSDAVERVAGWKPTPIADVLSANRSMLVGG